MEIVTSWMKEGLKKGREEGLEQGERKLLMRQLREKLARPWPGDGEED